MTRVIGPFVAVLWVLGTFWVYATGPVHNTLHSQNPSFVLWTFWVGFCLIQAAVITSWVMWWYYARGLRRAQRKIERLQKFCEEQR